MQQQFWIGLIGIQNGTSAHQRIVHDGMTIDEQGGKKVATIKVPEGPANCCFGGDDFKTLFITARTGLYSIRTVHAGAKPKGASW